MKNKRSQIVGTAFLYIVASVLFVMILMYGYSAIQNFRESSKVIKMINLKTDLTTNAKRMSRGFNIETVKLVIPEGYDQICFVNLGWHDDSVVPGSKRDYAGIDDSCLCKEPRRFTAGRANDGGPFQMRNPAQGCKPCGSNTVNDADDNDDEDKCRLIYADEDGDWDEDLVEDDYNQLICDSWRDNINENVFLVPKQPISIYIGQVMIDKDENGQDDGYVCFDTYMGSVKLVMEGMGDRTVISKYLAS